MKPLYGLTYEGVLDVPAVRESDGIPIVGVDGFSYQERLLGIQFYEGSQVKYIGSFEGCTGIEFIRDMPATVEKIGDYAFQGCERLRDVTLNYGLKYIGISCFEGCASLESITLPKSLKVLREYAFRNCATFDNWGNFTGGGLESVVFEDGVDFYNNNGFFCFYNNVFWGCANLSSVTLPKNTPGDFIIPPGTFGYCGNLKSIEFPTNTKKIEQLAFYRTGLTSLDLTKIELEEEEPFYLSGYYTFAACENLKTITAKGKVHIDGLYIFQECTALETATFTGSGNDYTVMSPDIFKRCSKLKSVEFYHLKGNGQDNDMDSVFTDCTSLERVTSTCPPEISKIGYSCFDGCKSLKTLSLPQTEYLINETAFRNCTALESFDLANVTSIGTQAFNGCSALTSISINNIPTMEKEDAFDEWHFANTEIAVPDEKYSTFTSDAYWGKFSNFKHPSLFAYTEVPGGYSVSKSPYALEADFTGMLEIPAKYNSINVVAVADGAFQGFTGLTGVTLPEGLKTIGSNAFAGCTGIKTVNNMCTEAITGDDVCPENIFDASVYGAATLYVPFGCYDAFSNYAPWKKFSTIKQGFGERTLNAPTASTESGDFNWSFDLTLTNPNEVGSIYYYIVSEGEAGNVGYQTFPYQHPITIPAKTCTVWTYVSDGINCSEPNSFKYTYVRLATKVGLDKVLSANFGERYFIDTNLYGHYHDGIYLYASTMGNSGSSKNTFNVDKKTEWWSDKEGDFNQEDWVAISGLSNEYVGRQIESGSLATVGPNTNYPVISFSGSLKSTPATMGINTFRVANFNIHAESAAVNNIWLVAPQPAEYCTVTGYVDIKKMHVGDGYLVLQSAEGPTIQEDKTEIEPLTMNVYYNTTTKAVDHDGWYAFTGIVSKEGESLKFTALSVDEKPTGVEGVDAGTARVFAAGGNINVAADTQTAITVYSANGQLVTALEATDATIAVSPGFYVVKVGNRVTKLAVK
ncbi:MAG: leucine-rich repeat protein [Bacteroidales bacterium]|nr:leucine-rich repeat protein [Bacteroidales bacterium]